MLSDVRPRTSDLCDLTNAVCYSRGIATKVVTSQQVSRASREHLRPPPGGRLEITRPQESRGRRTMDQDNREHSVSRRRLLGATAAALTAGGVSPLAFAQTRKEIEKGMQNNSVSNPGPINKALTAENPGSYLPPITDRGVFPPIWYSFDLTHHRITSLTAAYRTAGGRARSRKPSFPPQRMWPASPCA